MTKTDSLPTLTSAEYRRTVTETEDRDAAQREVFGEVIAFEPRELSRVIEDTLRSLTKNAALSDAVLEVKTVRVCHPYTSAVSVVKRVARDIRNGGHRVEVGPSWSRDLPPDAVVGVGIGGDATLADFVRSLPAWTVADSEY